MKEDSLSRDFPFGLLSYVVLAALRASSQGLPVHRARRKSVILTQQAVSFPSRGGFCPALVPQSSAGPPPPGPDLVTSENGMKKVPPHRATPTLSINELCGSDLWAH